MTNTTTIPTQTLVFEQADLIRYAAVSNDFNPIHYDRESALAAGLPGVVVHGMLTMAVLARYLDAWNAGRFFVTEYRARFRGFVQPSQPVHLYGVVKDEEADTVTVNLSLTVDGQEKPAVTAEARLTRRA